MRLKATMPQEIYDKIYFRVRTYEEGFPLAESGKREKRSGKKCKKGRIAQAKCFQ